MKTPGCHCIERAEAVRLRLIKIPPFMNTALITSGLEDAKEAYLDQASWSTATINYEDDDYTKLVLIIRLMKDWSALHVTRELLLATGANNAICKKRPFMSHYDCNWRPRLMRYKEAPV